MPGHSCGPLDASPRRSTLLEDDVNGLSLLALILIAVAIVAAYRVGRMHGRREGPPPAALASPSASALRAGAEPALAPAIVAPAPVTPAAAPQLAATFGDDASIAAEKTRLIVAYEAEAARLRRELVAAAANAGQ